MSYQEVTEYLFNQTANFEKQGVTGYKEGLGNVLALDEHYSHPHKQFKTIHVAGTNGKGSVSHLIASQLQTCGYKVGLYTSPHIVDFRERIRVNGIPVTEEYVVKFVEEGKALFDTIKPSFFEIATIMAFCYFKDMDVDVAVVEVGLGGRLDSTNIITPILSIITNVSLDHTQLLGNSLEQIAQEKGGIIKHGVPVIIGEATPETRKVFDKLAEKANAPIVYAEDEQEIESYEETSKGIHYKAKHFGEFDCELRGAYQPKNTNTVVVAMRRMMDLGYLACCTEPGNNSKMQHEMNTAFTEVTKLTGLMGRWQVIKTQPTVVCDTGHNPGAWQYLSKQLEEQDCRQLRIVFGMVEDKDVHSVMSMLPKKATYYFTKGSTKRAMPETSLKAFAEQLGLKGDCYPTVDKAYRAAMEGTTEDDFIFIGGSTYIVADFMKNIV